MTKADQDTFIPSLLLPSGFEAYRYRGLNRVHFKYYGDGFMVVDMKKRSYNLGTRERFLNDLRIENYVVTENLGPNRALIKDIPYNNTTLLYILIGYIAGKNHA